MSELVCKCNSLIELHLMVQQNAIDDSISPVLVRELCTFEVVFYGVLGF